MTWTTRPRSDLGPLAAIVEGQGPCLVLLHGVGLCADAWARQIDVLAERFRVVAPDLPGHGQSPGFDRMPDLTAYSDRVLEALADEQSVVVVGHSMGAMIALSMAAQAPDRVRGVAALNAIFNRSETASKAVKARAAQLDGSTSADPALTLERWFGDTQTPEREACARWLREVSPKSYKHAYTVFAQENGPGQELLSAMTCPALFMTGADEPNSTPAMSKTMARIAPRGQVKILPGAAHMMPMTHPWDVTDAVLALAGEVWL